MEQNILYSMGKEGASNLVSLLSKPLEPVVDMHKNDRCVKMLKLMILRIRTMVSESDLTP